MATRADLRTRTLRRMDAVGSGRWDTTASATGEVDQVLDFVFDKEWKRILNADPYYRTAQVQPTADSSGRYAISGLSTASQRFYRVIGIAINNAAYKEVTRKQYLLGPTLNLGYRVWWHDGDYIYALPTEPNKVLSGNDGIFINHLPTKISALATDGTTFTFPDGYEEILALEAAAFLLAKGGAETGASAEFRQMAEGLRQDMLSDIARFSMNPQQMQYDDYPFDWGG